MLEVPFIISDINGKEYNMKYSVEFVCCDKNNKNEVFPVIGWIVSPNNIILLIIILWIQMEIMMMI